MNILFFSLLQIRNIYTQGLYQALLRQFLKAGHYVRIISPVYTESTRDIREKGWSILQVNTPQMAKANFIRKGIASLRIGSILRSAIAKYCADEHYDLIVVATPPVTIAGTVKWLKQRDGAKVYLLLKDIWPQAIVDLGAISQNGLIYKYYRFREQQLYTLADRIGCMSPANMQYLLVHNPGLLPEKVEIFPNCIEIDNVSLDGSNRDIIRRRYDLDPKAIIFVIGGNLSSGHDFPFALKCFFELEKRDEPVQLLLVGAGTHVKSIQTFVKVNHCKKIRYIPELPVSEYEELVSACDVGLILLDRRFTIPNFPSRLLSYMKAQRPVFVISDTATDVGQIAEQNGFGWWCQDGDEKGFSLCMKKIYSSDLSSMGKAAFEFMKREYNVEKNAPKILRDNL